MHGQMALANIGHFKLYLDEQSKKNKQKEKTPADI